MMTESFESLKIKKIADEYKIGLIWAAIVYKERKRWQDALKKNRVIISRHAPEHVASAIADKEKDIITIQQGIACKAICRWCLVNDKPIERNGHFYHLGTDARSLVKKQCADCCRYRNICNGRHRHGSISGRHRKPEE